ncbi:MAG: hypothetical protein ACTSRW_02265 [Candidatus Helarchaeota archaeon]
MDDIPSMNALFDQGCKPIASTCSSPWHEIPSDLHSTWLTNSQR